MIFRHISNILCRRILRPSPYCGQIVFLKAFLNHFYSLSGNIIDTAERFDCVHEETHLALVGGKYQSKIPLNSSTQGYPNKISSNVGTFGYRHESLWVWRYPHIQLTAMHFVFQLYFDTFLSDPAFYTLRKQHSIFAL